MIKAHVEFFAVALGPSHHAQVPSADSRLEFRMV